MARKTSRWDVADSLKPKEDIAAYLDAALDDGDPDLLKATIGDIARAKGMTEIAEAAGLGRANLYKALSPDGNPEFATLAESRRLSGFASPSPRDDFGRTGGSFRDGRPVPSPTAHA